MRRAEKVNRAVLATLFVVGTMQMVLPQNVWAASDPSLVISQFKITSSNGQFITLYNPTNSTIDMTKFQLQYFNSYDLAKATSSRMLALVGTLSPHGFYTVSDDDLVMCYRMVVDSTSLGFSSTAGMIQVLQLAQNSNGASVIPTIQDFVSWSKSTATGAQTLPTSSSAWLQRRPVDSQGSPNVVSPGSGSWMAVQKDSTDACNIITLGTNIPTTLNSGLLPPVQPPLTIINILSSSSPNQLAGSNLPDADQGLMMPLINELLPNPSGNGNDLTKEFIELYNPNAVEFDLSGFSLQTGLTTFHNYKFDQGASLAPLSFTAFYSTKTGASLSNSAGQARLLDPNGNLLNQTAEYSNAKDGQSWAYASGKWVWTSDVTPGLANIVRNSPSNLATSTKKSKTSSSTKTRLQKVSKSTPKTKKLRKPKKQKVIATAMPIANSSQKTSVNLHFLAAVIVAAIIYVAYEYRAEISNRYRRFRGHKATR